MEQTSHCIDFHILDSGIPQAIKSSLSRYITIYPNAHLCFHPIPIEDIQNFPTPAHFSVATYARFYIADLVPDIDKALYIDVDTCVVGDIADFFMYDLQDYGLGAVSGDSDNIYLPPSTWLLKHKEELTMGTDEYYFCAGVLLINCTYWRQHKIKQKSLELMNHAPHRFTHPDQDVLNLLFRSNYKILPPHTQYFASESSVAYNNYIKEHMKESQCIIIHYTSGRKPWNSPEEEISFSEFWWQYAKLTPFYYDYILELMNIRTKEIIKISRYIYKKSLYRYFLLYLKYKTSRGEKRKQYKKQYYTMKELSSFSTMK